MRIREINRKLRALATLIQLRIKAYLSQEIVVETAFMQLIQQFEDLWVGDTVPKNYTVEENILLFISLIPHFQHQFFDEVISSSLSEAGNFPQVGGIRGKNHRGFLPTGETALFILAGKDLDKRLKIQELFSSDHNFAKQGILYLEEVPEGEPKMSGKIILAPEYVELFTTGKVAPPKFSMHFPAQLLETEYTMGDIVLNKTTHTQIEELKIWVNHHQSLMKGWGMKKKLKPGYRALFHGPPGTGKTLTASVLGQETGKSVYKIDLSMIVSKFIGETEKNLSNLFAKAEHKDWILFFDEADALFGKRTNVRDAHDKYANQEVSYLLQRVESYDGLVILATNFKNNIDDAFVRRFQSIVHFPLPGVEERLDLWKKAFPLKKVKLAKEINFEMVAQKYELTGAHIMNIVQYACLQTLAEKSTTIQQEFLLEGIRREFAKEGKFVA